MPGAIVEVGKEDRATGILKADSGRCIKRGYVIADDNLAGEKIYYDRGTVLRQLGVFYEPEITRRASCAESSDEAR